MKRDDAWLAERVRLLWENHFADVPKGYPIVTRFNTRSRNRFGSIAARNGRSVILINQLFADPAVPTYVVDGTLAHELAHYAHGFGSGLPKKYAHAHRGGVVDIELEKRGLGELNARSERWRKAHWEGFYDSCCGDIVARRAARNDSTASVWQTYLTHAEKRTEGELCARMAALGPRLGFTFETSAPFLVEWLHATRRQTGTSYWYAKTRVVRIHGLLADRRVPDVVVDFEIAYWLARQAAGSRWQSVHAALCAAGLETIAADALRWRRHAWTAFRKRNHPLA